MFNRITSLARVKGVMNNHFNARSFLLLGIVSISILIGTSCRRAPVTTGARLSPLNTQGTNEELKMEMYQDAKVAAGEIIVKLARCPPDTTFLIQKLTSDAKERTGDSAITVTQVGNGCWFLIHSPNLSVSTIFEKLLTNPAKLRIDPKTDEETQIIHGEPNFIIQIIPTFTQEAVPSCDEDLYQEGKLWGLENRTPGGIDAKRAWTVTKGSRDIVVGVMDSGISYDHVDLHDNVWHAPNDFPIRLGTETIPCLAGTHGYNALAASEDKRCYPLDNDIANLGHGTHVSGIIGAVGDNNKGVIGVNWYVSLLGLKVTGQAGNGTVVGAAKAIEFALQLKQHFGSQANLRVFNASWYYRIGKVDPKNNELIKYEIELAGGANVLFVAAAGNSGTNNNTDPYYPANFDLPNIISVAAIDQAGALDTSSNFGDKTVHLGAPGVGIYSTFPLFQGSCYYRMSGTSMAAPFVSGVAALISSLQKCANLPPIDVRKLILDGTVKTPPVINTTTGGRLNAYNSIMPCQQ